MYSCKDDCSVEFGGAFPNTAGVDPIKKGLPEREIHICQRLRAFREAKQISRTAFALTIGIGSDRLASYEAARVPLRYEVFRAIAQHFFINPYWLADGDSNPVLHGPFDDSQFIAQVKRRALFSEVYDLFLAQAFNAQFTAAGSLIGSYIAAVKEMRRWLDDQPPEAFETPYWQGKVKEMEQGTKDVIAKLRAAQKVSRAFKSLREKAIRRKRAWREKVIRSRRAAKKTH